MPEKRKKLRKPSVAIDLRREYSSADTLNKGEIFRVLSERIAFGGTLFVVDFEEIKSRHDAFDCDKEDNQVREFAKDLKVLCRDSDVIGKIGGEVYLVFMPEQQLDCNEIRSVVGRFRQRIQERIEDGNLGKEFKNKASIGVLVAEEDKYHSVSEVLGCLNEALYLSQNSDKESYIFSDQETSVFAEAFQIEAHSALTREETMSALQAMNSALFGNYFIRLTDMSYVSLRDMDASRAKLLRHTEANVMLRKRVEKFVKAEHQEKVYAFADLETLAERMKEQDRISCEYQDIYFGWCISNFVCAKRENGIVTQVILMQSSLTDAKEKEQKLLSIQKKANDLLSNSELLFITLIDRDTGKTKIVQTPNSTSIHKVYDFDSAIKIEADYILPQEREEFLKKASLKRIIEELQENRKYTVTCLVQGKDKDQRVIAYHFSYYDEAEDSILSATEDITSQIIYDSVTKQLNFNGFKIRCRYGMCAEKSDQFVILNFNIYNFKAVNNLYGFDAGNWLLGEVLRKLQQSKLSFLAACRENADNFFCLCRKDMLDLEEVERLCKMEIISENQTEDNLQMFCGIFHVQDAKESFESMCDKARLARRKAEKETGVNYYVFDEKEQAQYLDEATILAEIPKAIKNKELVVYYQPIYDAKTKKVVSAESLIRWNHPQKGLISPGIFIPAIEKTEQIAEVDLYVACSVQAYLQQRMEEGKPILPISINMSRYDFLRKSSMDSLRHLFKLCPEIADSIRIEITESGFINIPDNGEVFIRELRQQGIKTMIDDFGTGFSSLASITERHCDIIKLDMSFAQQITTNKKIEKIIIAVINTAHELDILVVAEGVETKEQYEFLREHNCDYIQGYYFSKPIPKVDFDALLKKEGY